MADAAKAQRRRDAAGTTGTRNRVGPVAQAILHAASR
jgi:hypothetical protein